LYSDAAYTDLQQRILDREFGDFGGAQLSVPKNRYAGLLHGLYI
jgi:hypothetical protein